ncbi:hypothetical protein CAPTEDRAFT_201503 [Capitella teleta]|uniref:Uncharacterized protein n=1 Tax=Capitella teleta TaxID=283909 RepID=R7UFB8_CAPTE|nr:hypothetical protein CAPTEDRAFT_201503 [Capitella teleta]|eukprot:ELU04808.1 hypothetical protein CAPTEDRAFT_201503 [Capitella teleta]
MDWPKTSVLKKEVMVISFDVFRVQQNEFFFKKSQIRLSHPCAVYYCLWCYYIPYYDLGIEIKGEKIDNLDLLCNYLQHLVWILGLKPSSGGSLRATQQASDNPNAVITTAVMADLPVLSAMLSRLFESSQYLDDVALHHLIDALCKLSQESMELAYSNRSTSIEYSREHKPCSNDCDSEFVTRFLVNPVH